MKKGRVQEGTRSSQDRGMREEGKRNKGKGDLQGGKQINHCEDNNGGRGREDDVASDQQGGGGWCMRNDGKKDS